MEVDAQKSSYKFQAAFEISTTKKHCKQETTFVAENLQQRKCIHPRSPRIENGAPNACVPDVNLTSSSKQSVSITLGQTPPAKRYQKVRNPFEAALTERLHLPLIASPLFQQPVTPQMSSTKFEWTIDEVSSLIPVNVEPHETQFQDSPNPELEAKAQVAITSYFKDQRIVPSPVDCPLRNHRIILTDTPIDIKNQRKKDCGSQTELTLPAKLPTHLEEALRPYLKPQLCQTIDICTTRASRSKHIKDAFSDTSLRRKLFDMNNVLIVENNAHDITTSMDNKVKSGTSVQVIMRKLSDSLDKSSVGSFSPMSTFDSLSPLTFTANDVNDSAINHKSCINDFFKEEDVELSPIQLPSNGSLNSHTYEKGKENRSPNLVTQNYVHKENRIMLDDKFTPDRSSSPVMKSHCYYNNITNTNAVDLSSDSFNIKISRLKVNTSGRNSLNTSILSKKDEESDNKFPENTLNVTEDFNENMGDIQFTPQVNANNIFLNNADTTPRSRRRSINRKNLSQSFTTKWLNGQDVNFIMENDENHLSESIIEKKSAQKTENVQREIPTKSVVRTDSGFTEISNDNTTFAEDGMFCASSTNQDFPIYI